MPAFSFIVPGPPVPKGRPRFTRQGGVYTPPETVKFERHIIHSFREKAMYEPYKLDQEKAAELDITFAIEIPKSWSKTKKEAALNQSIRPTVKPDLDNLQKAILDGLNGFAWKDDKFITQITARKIYADKGYTEIKITQVAEQTTE